MKKIVFTITTMLFACVMSIFAQSSQSSQSLTELKNKTDSFANGVVEDFPAAKQLLKDTLNSLLQHKGESVPLLTTEQQLQEAQYDVFVFKITLFAVSVIFVLAMIILSLTTRKYMKENEAFNTLFQKAKLEHERILVQHSADEHLVASLLQHKKDSYERYSNPKTLAAIAKEHLVKQMSEHAKPSYVLKIMESWGMTKESCFQFHQFLRAYLLQKHFFEENNVFIWINNFSPDEKLEFIELSKKTIFGELVSVSEHGPGMIALHVLSPFSKEHERFMPEKNFVVSR